MPLAVLLWIGVFRLILLLVVVLAFRLGGGPEKVAAAVFLMATIASQPFLGSRHGFGSFLPSLALIDCVVLISLWTISLYANRWWPIPAAGAQLVACLAHAVKLLYPEGSAIAYEQMVAVSAWPTLLFLMAGLTIHIWKARRGADPSWSRSPPPPVLNILRRLRLD